MTHNLSLLVHGLACCILASGCARASEPDASPAEAKASITATPGGEIILAGVTWPDAASVDREALAALPEPAQQAAARSPVPVLVPGKAVLLASATVIAEANYYALSTRANGVTVAIHATRISHRYPSIRPAEGTTQMRGGKGFVTQNEGIYSAIFREHGVSYAVDVECDNPSAGPCADDSYLRDLVEQLAFVGGSGVVR